MSEDKTIIERVGNGWVLKKPNEMGDGYETHVFEDLEDGPNGEAESLCNLLWEAFNYYYRSKRSAGLVVSVEDSHEQEEQNEPITFGDLLDDDMEWSVDEDDLDEEDYDLGYDFED